MTTPPSSSPDQDLLARVQHAVDPLYDIQAEIGRGGAGIVYRAIDRRLKRNVALKILPPDLAFRSDTRERFMREAEMSARLNHPNIVPIYSVDEREGLAWFAMAMIDGGSLGDRVRARGALSIADASRLLRDVADALSYAHARGVVHRDIKPDNILIDSQSGRGMVTDFGIARATTEGESRLTATGAAIGTPAYMSPEQCAGDRELDGRTDLYSLGAVAYDAITGQPPFDGPSTPVIMMKQVTEQPVPMSRYRQDVPRALDRIVMKLLAKDPSHRFQDGTALLAAIDGAEFDSGTGGFQSSTYPGLGQRAAMPDLDEDGQRATAGFSDFMMKPRMPFGVPGLSSSLEPLPGWDARVAARTARIEARQARYDEKRLRKEAKESSRPLPDRIRSFRRHMVSYLSTTAFLFGINAATGGHFWWAVFPALGMMMGLVNEGGSLWAAGARMRDVFGTRRDLPPGSADSGAAASLPRQPGSLPADVSQEVLEGGRGAVLRQAVLDRNAIKDLIARLSESDRGQIPDVASTTDGLYERVHGLASVLHRLDREIGPERLNDLDSRIADAEKADNTADRERMLRLLKRQRDTIANLVKSRETLSEQYESAGLLLQNLKLDLIRMRSSGLQSGLADVSSVTQEARALSREIGYVLAAADELRDI